MSTYILSDIHGDYEGYQTIIEKIHFSKDDVLYVNGDVLDRGTGSLQILQHMMMQPNIYPILGNHEYMACQCLRFLMQEITEDSIASLEPGMVEGLLEWQNIGGQQTMDAFHKLTRDEQQDILDYLEEFSLYEEITVKGETYVIVHAGLDHFAPERPLEDYGLHELIFQSPDYETVYFPDKYLVTGHLPTRVIEGNPRPDRIYRENRHIALDCGAGFGGQIGAICLETGEEYYSGGV